MGLFYSSSSVWLCKITLFYSLSMQYVGAAYKALFTRVCVEALYSKTQSIIVDSKSAFIDDEFLKNETGGRKKSIMANRQWHSARRSDPRSTIPILKFTERACTALAGWQMITELAMLRFAIFDTRNFSLNPSPGPEQHRNEWSPVCARKAAGKFELLPCMCVLHWPPTQYQYVRDLFQFGSATNYFRNGKTHLHTRRHFFSSTKFIYVTFI